MENKFLNFILCVLLSIGFTSCVSEKTSQNIPQSRLNYLAVNHGVIEYYELGKTGSPIVVIGGYGTDLSTWSKSFLYTLAEKHRLIIFNNRGVGHSYIPSTHYSTKDLATDIEGMLDGLHITKASILGISMGGMIAQQFAVMYPNKTSHLILINTLIAGKKARPPQIPIQEMMLHMPKAKIGQYMLALKLFFPSGWKLRMSVALINDRFLPADYTEVQISDLTLQQQQELVIHWLNDNKTAAQIVKLRIPTLILSGTADQVIPPMNSQILANSISNAKWSNWREGGHAMIFQYPQEIANRINDFLVSA